MYVKCCSRLPFLTCTWYTIIMWLYLLQSYPLIYILTYLTGGLHHTQDTQPQPVLWWDNLQLWQCLVHGCVHTYVRKTLGTGWARSVWISDGRQRLCHTFPAAGLERSGHSESAGIFHSSHPQWCQRSVSNSCQCIVKNSLFPQQQYWTCQSTKEKENFSSKRPFIFKLNTCVRFLKSNFPNDISGCILSDTIIFYIVRLYTSSYITDLTVPFKYGGKEKWTNYKQ